MLPPPAVFTTMALRELVTWTQDVHAYVPKCITCYKAILVITGRVHCFHNYTCKYMYVYMYVCTKDFMLMCACFSDLFKTFCFANISQPFG